MQCKKWNLLVIIIYRYVSLTLISVILCDRVSNAKSLLESGADSNLLGTGDAAAIHLAAGTQYHSDIYTALLLNYSANPNLL